MARAAPALAGGFREAVSGDAPALSVELALKRDGGAAAIRDQARLFRGRVHGIQVQDNPLAWVHMSPLAASSLLLDEGIDPVPQLTCRDRNRIGLLSDLLGLQALGVESVLLGRGRRVGKRHALHASTVFDMTGRELIAMGAGLGEETGHPFFIGCGAKARRVRPNWTADALTARGEAGAEFLQTQLCFNVDLLSAWLEALVEARLTWRFSVVVSLAVFPSVETVKWVRKRMTDSKIPAALIERLESADDPRAEGIALCAETMKAVAALPGVSGIHLMSMGDPESLAEAIDASGLSPLS
ncbi:MAG: methylenetetrahydrofolate reductase [Xanthomonadales bacterium]|nr:methylenetetrahydrofolate reductase [Xanthomonadales bacterium]